MSLIARTVDELPEGQRVEILIGAHYELPDGSIAKLVSYNTPDKQAGYYCDDGKGTQIISLEEFSAWKSRRDLRDFPNASNPRLPHVFDLVWDIEYTSQLRWALENGHEDLDEIKEMMVTHGIEI